MRRQATAAISAARSPALLAAAMLAAACGEPPPGGEPIDREVFIEAYVELRLAALASDDFILTPEQQEAILARHGVDEERLLHFADVHGRDTDFMSDVWAEVDRLIQDRSPTDDPSA